jgi:hypothetical protein
MDNAALEHTQPDSSVIVEKNREEGGHLVISVH